MVVCIIIFISTVMMKKFDSLLVSYPTNKFGLHKTFRKHSMA